ncbi:hypothetical protein TSACC_2200 [Terrimicrobium sacchariphilum]|uniref:Uncharacterized protein n=1 Tax=Terrimicrobium sacchariphilum TaxID=690879 RepID=A0A146G4U9_TERSA|nr:hypothetical protein TSACC_2200 [Terrimicrobium sacchariphilum]
MSLQRQRYSHMGNSRLFRYISLGNIAIHRLGGFLISVLLTASLQGIIFADPFLSQKSLLPSAAYTKRST